MCFVIFSFRFISLQFHLSENWCLMSDERTKTFALHYINAQHNTHTLFCSLSTSLSPLASHMRNHTISLTPHRAAESQAQHRKQNELAFSRRRQKCAPFDWHMSHALPIGKCLGSRDGDTTKNGTKKNKNRFLLETIQSQSVSNFLNWTTAVCVCDMLCLTSIKTFYNKIRRYVFVCSAHANDSADNVCWLRRAHNK